MRILERWLADISPSQKILDIGCGRGSLRQLEGQGLSVFGVDIDCNELAGNPRSTNVCAVSNRLPFPDQTFDLVICHHSMEHFPELSSTLQEIRRVLKPTGKLFVSVPDGASFSDRLYRLLLCGGGHVQLFSFDGMVSAIESAIGLHLAASRELFTSFIFVDKLNFLPAPQGRLPGPLPRRMRLLGQLPTWCFNASRILLNLGSRALDSLLPTKLARYGWAFAFAPEPGSPLTEPACTNVCMSCGAGLDDPIRTKWLLYRCPHCSSLNPFFPT